MGWPNGESLHPSLHIAGCSSDGDTLRTDHLATRGSRGIGSNQPVLLTTLHTEECALSRHAQLIGNMSLELGKEDIRRGIRTRYEGSDGTNHRCYQRIEISRYCHQTLRRWQ